MGVRIVADESVAVEKPKHPRKKRQAVMDESGSSHPPKKLRGDHGTSSGAAIGGKSPSVLKELLAGSMLNAEAGVQAVATLPLVTSSVSVTPEHESGVPTDSIFGLNLLTIGASERFVISSDSFYHSSTNASVAEADSVIRSAVVPLVMTEAVITSHAVIAPHVPVSESGTKIPSPVHASVFFLQNTQSLRCHHHWECLTGLLCSLLYHQCFKWKISKGNFSTRTFHISIGMVMSLALKVPEFVLVATATAHLWSNHVNTSTRVGFMMGCPDSTVIAVTLAFRKSDIELSLQASMNSTPLSLQSTKFIIMRIFPKVVPDLDCVVTVAHLLMKFNALRPSPILWLIDVATATPPHAKWLTLTANGLVILLSSLSPSRFGSNHMRSFGISWLKSS
nr:hypothetical protein [Tanacetum cinerariifolium]